jgi:hypothetical protein
MANPEHLELLRRGVEVWNAWRAIERSTKPDLSGADLRGADLIKADLSGANLSSALFIKADLSWATLRRRY